MGAGTEGQPGSRRTTAASAARASAGSSWFHGTIQVRAPKRIGLNWSSQARSQSSSCDGAEAGTRPVQSGSKASSAASSTSASVSTGNSAVSTSALHSGVWPTPGSRMARSLPVSASASTSVTESAPRSSSAFS
jgi:hypothetical protein